MKRVALNNSWLLTPTILGVLDRSENIMMRSRCEQNDSMMITAWAWPKGQSSPESNQLSNLELHRVKGWFESRPPSQISHHSRGRTFDNTTRLGRILLWDFLSSGDFFYFRTAFASAVPSGVVFHLERGTRWNIWGDELDLFYECSRRGKVSFLKSAFYFSYGAVARSIPHSLICYSPGAFAAL